MNAKRYITRWVALLAAFIMIGGVLAYGLITFIADRVGEMSREQYNPMWMAIPAMIVIAVPITIFISRMIYKHFEVLTKAMSEVVDGKSEVHITVEPGNAFNGIYEDFNKMAAEIAGLERLRSEIVDGLSHELKTPVASINGFAKILLDEDLPEEKRRKYLEIIVKESGRLADLAQSNLLLTKIDAQEIVTDKKSYNLGRQIQDIAISMETAWSEKSINISAELPDVMYEGNAGLMESLWQNLLGNAIKFTPRNGDIGITLIDGEENITVSVMDTGMGMDAEVKERIFERYYQGDVSRTGEGHGLGLSIVNRVVRLCGGTITVDSKEGEGSTFTVTLPK